MQHLENYDVHAMQDDTKSYGMQDKQINKEGDINYLNPKWLRQGQGRVK